MSGDDRAKPGPPPSGPPLRYDYQRLTAPSPLYSGLTYPRFAPLLARCGETPAGILAIGAHADGAPAGLALLAPQSPSGARRLLSVMVESRHRRAGVAARLIAESEAAAASTGTTSLYALHSTLLKSRTAFEALMRRAGWNSPVEIEFRLTAEAGAFERAKVNWASLLARLGRDGYRAVAWTAITDEDRREIAAMRENGEPLAREFDPLHPGLQGLLVPEVSVLLRQGDRIAGWVTATRGLKPGMCHYSNGYIVPSLRNRGWLIAGMCSVCERQSDVFGPKALAVFETSPDNTKMRRLMERGLAPYSLWTDIRYKSEKILRGV